MELFEEMRQSDDAVFTAVEARRQEINSANWLLAGDSQSKSTEVLDFVEDNLYPQLERLLRLLTGALSYGFGALEPVYEWSDAPFVTQITRGKIQRAAKTSGRRIYLRKLAHIRPTTVQSFRIKVTGELESIYQHTFNGTMFLPTDIPAAKLLLWVYDQQGDDYWGVPPARHCYKAWKFKSQIERLNLMHLDKFGVGTPVVEEGEGWTEPERTRMAGFVNAWRSGTSNFILHPSGGKITIIGDEGKSTMAALEWVKYYNIQIAKTYLTQGTELGSTQTGARALGEVFFEQLGGIVQADCEDLASLINNLLIVPLVQWNFGPQDVYPTFAPSQRVKKGTGVASVLQQLVTAGAIHILPEDEVWARDIFGMPTVELKTLEDAQLQRDAKAQAIADAAANAAKNGPTPAGPADKNAPKPPVKVAASVLHQLSGTATGAPDPAPAGMTYRTREFSTWEQTVLRPDVLLRDLDVQAARLTGEVHDVLRAIDDALAAQVRAVAEQGAAALAGHVRDIAVPGRLRSRLRSVLFDAAQRARDYGAAAVRNEVQRQLDPDGIGPQRSPSIGFPVSAESWPSAGGTGEAPGYYRAILRGIRHLVKLVVADATDPEQAARDLHLAAEVDRAVEDEVDRREQSARSSVLSAIAQAGNAAGAVLATIVSAGVKAALLGLSTGRTEQNVQGVVNVGFGVGRATEAAAINEAAATDGSGGKSGLVDAAGNAIELVAKVYSAVMDLGTCDECAKWDGGRFPIDYPEDYTGVQAPNPRCYGGYGRCRCLWIYVTNLESVPLVPAAKGPTP